MADISQKTVYAAIEADVAWARETRAVVWQMATDDRMRYILEAVAPVIVAAEHEQHAGKYGQIVREKWVDWALEQPDVGDHPSWTVPWDKLPARDREVDHRIGSAVAAQAVHDAGLEVAEYQKEIARLRRNRKWAEDWAEEGRDRDGNLLLRHKESGGVYRVLPVEET